MLPLYPRYVWHYDSDTETVMTNQLGPSPNAYGSTCAIASPSGGGTGSACAVVECGSGSVASTVEGGSGSTTFTIEGGTGEI